MVMYVNDVFRVQQQAFKFIFGWIFFMGEILMQGMEIARDFFKKFKKIKFARDEILFNKFIPRD